MSYILQLNRLDERLKMSCIRLDDAFLKCVNVQIKGKKFRKPIEIFYELDKLKQALRISCENPDSPPDERFYWSENDYIKADRGILSSDEAAEIDNNILSSEKLLNCVNEFRRFLLEYPITIFYSKEPESEHKIPSNKLFATASSFLEILSTKFFSYGGHDLYVDNEELENRIKRVYGYDQYLIEMELSKKKQEFLQKDKNAYCMNMLFGSYKYEDIFEKFPDDASYADDGEVAEYLKKEYALSQHMVIRVVLPSLRVLRS